jgi:PAS domain S-box-containing protein
VRIRSQLIVLVVAAVAPMVVLIALLTTQLWRVQRDAFDARNLDRVSALRLALEVEIESVERLLKSLRASPDFAPDGPNYTAVGRMQRLLLTNPNWEAMGLLLPDGTPIVRAQRPGDSVIDLDAGTRQRVLGSADSAVSDLVASADGKRLTTFIAVPVLRDGAVVAVLYTSITNDGWLALLQRFPISPRSTITLNDRQANVIARTLDHAKWSGRQSNAQYWQGTVGRNEGVQFNQGLGGQRFYSAFSRLRSSDWVLGIGVPQDEVDAALFWPTLAMLVGIAFTGALAVLLATVFGRRVTGGMLRLADAARAIGDPAAARAVRPLQITEAEWVRQAMLEASEELAARSQALQKAAKDAVDLARARQLALDAADRAHRELHFALSSIDDQFIVLDRSFQYVLVNQRVLEITGKAEHELLGRSMFDVFPNLKGTLFEKMLREVVERHAPARFEFSYGAHGRIYENAMYPTDTGVALVVSDVTDRKGAEEALMAADRRKDEFLATLAHELRNPLAPISNAAALLGAIQDASPQLVWIREMIQRQIVHLTRLIDDLMDVSRITRNKLELHKERLLLGDVLSQAVEATRPLLEQRGHALALEIDDEMLAVEADTVRLTQVFANLLNNAAKYTPAGGHLTLRVRRTTDSRNEPTVTVDVCDDGIGIAPDQLPRLFDLFFQIDPSLERSHGGLGIGLSLVRQLVLLHGGTISAHSDGPGKGTCFTVVLPALPVEPFTVAVAGGSASEAPHGGTPAACLAVVDDNRDAADSLAAVLRSLGYDVRVAFDGLAGRDLILRLRPAAAIIDLSMPGLNGYDLCRAVRAQLGKSITLFSLTGYGQPGDRQQSAEAGFDAHLVKPVDPRVLERALAAALARSEHVTVRPR